MGTRKRKPTGKDYGRRLYVTDRPYMDQMGDTTVRHELEIMLFKHSEFEKPYLSDDYPDMQYRYHPPQDPPPGPGPVPPDPHPPRPNPIDPDPPIWILFRCFFEGCFCPGQEKCGTLNCSQDITGAKSDSGTIKLTGGKTTKQMCITASASAKSTIRVKVSMVHFEYKGTRITLRKTGSHEFVVDECPEKDCCTCGGESIGYTSQQMTISTTQNLSVVGAKAGCSYTWEATNGTLSTSSGTATVFTAPSSNPDCASNAVITLKCEGTTVTTLSIAINSSSTADQMALSFCENRICPPCGSFSGYCGHCSKWMACDGRNWIRWKIGSNDSSCDCMGYAFPNEMYSDWQTCAAVGMAEGWADVRTPTQISQGCCPYQLL